MHLKAKLLIMTICCLVVTYFLYQQSNFTKTSQSGEQHQTPSSTSSSSQNSPFTLRQSGTQITSDISVNAEPSISAKIDKLTASGNPADAFSAYVLVERCINFAKTEKIKLGESRGLTEHEKIELRVADIHNNFIPKNERPNQEICASITQRQYIDRLKNLEIAAKAGISNSAVSFLNEGPFGNPSARVTQATDPYVIEWEKQARNYLQRDACKGNEFELFAYTKEYSQSKLNDDSLLLQIYESARSGIRKNLGLKPEPSVLFTNFKLQPTTEEQHSAEQEGIAIAAECLNIVPKVSQ